ncbi:hypothetical protein V8C34DRAFT_295814 [Trichoderma compactum]
MVKVFTLCLWWHVSAVLLKLLLHPHMSRTVTRADGKQWLFAACHLKPNLGFGPQHSLAAKATWPSSIEWRDRNTHARGTRDETHPAGLRLSYDISGVSHAEASPFAACDAMHTMHRLAGFVSPVRHACSSTNASAIFSQTLI